MERNSSIISRLRRRSTKTPSEDEWFIPYKPSTSSHPTHSGIGASPPPVRPERHAIFSVFSASSPVSPPRSPTKPSTSSPIKFSTGSPTKVPVNAPTKFSTQAQAPTKSSTKFASQGELDTGYQFPTSRPPMPLHASGSGHSYNHSNNHNHDHDQRNAPRRQGSGKESSGGLSKSPSYSSLLDRHPDRYTDSTRIASSTSVPTGLAAPKMLFSPLSREIRDGKNTHSSSHGPTYETPARQRTVSAPASKRRPQHPHPHPHPHPPSNHAKANPFENPVQPRRWAASTMCDLFVLPRPHITPHSITPPPSLPDEAPPSIEELEKEKVIAQGRAREAERDEWAEYIRRRGRSLSIGDAGPPPGAPIIGSLKARSRERERAGSTGKAEGRSRAGSQESKWSLRRASASRRGSEPAAGAGAERSNVSRKSSGATKKSHRSVPLQQRFSDGDRPTHTRRASEQANAGGEYRSHLAHSLSVPDLRTNEDTVGSRYPTRTVRLRDAPRMNRGVVVIGPADPAYRPAPDIPSSAAYAFSSEQGTHRRFDLSKPLPALPGAPDSKSPLLPIEHFVPLGMEIGVAISSDLGTPSKDSSLGANHGTEPDDATSGGPAHARAVLEKQHQRARTRRAFQTPAIGPPSYRKDSVRSTAVASTSQPSSVTSAFFSSTPRTVPTLGNPLNWSTSTTDASPLLRKTTALEEAIGRSRAASVGTVEGQDWTPVKSTLRPRARTSEGHSSVESIPLATVDDHAPAGPVAEPVSPPLAYPITTDATPRREVEAAPERSTTPTLRDRGTELRNGDTGRLLVPRPELLHVDSVGSTMSKTTMYTDASEGWARGELTPSAARRTLEESPDDVPSPVNLNAFDDSDFHGLFFRTPHDRHGSFTSTGPARAGPAQQPVFPPPKTNDKPAGLGLGLDPARRESSGEGSEGSTLELATPVIQSEVPNGHQEAETRMLEGFASRRPMSQDAASPIEEQEVRMSQGPIRRPTLIATPPRNGISGSRRSLVPEQATVQTATPAEQDSPPLSPRTFGVEPVAHTQSIHGSPLVASPVPDQRFSTVPSFVHDFPVPPSPSQPTRPLDSTQPAQPAQPDHPTDSTAMSTSTALEHPAESSHHASAFGQLVTGPPGAGKTTYCNGMHQFLTALGRPVHIINLDPAVPEPPYPCSINITSLITLESAMAEFGLGPNGGILYCLEYLEANCDWLVDELDKVLEAEGGNGYVIFDTPGQVELWTNHDSLRRMVERLTRLDYRLAAVHLSDAHYITDASKFISVVLLSLRAMLQLEMPHINVLSKIDLLNTYGELPFDLRYYTEARDLSYLLDSLEADPRSARFGALNRAMVELVEEYGMVGFETLAVEDRSSMLKLLRLIDKATGYIFVPPSTSTAHANSHALFSSALGIGAGEVLDLGDVDEVQERWGEEREVYDEVEREGWRREGEIRAARSRTGPAMGAESGLSTGPSTDLPAGPATNTAVGAETSEATGRATAQATGAGGQWERSGLGGQA